MNTKLNRNDLNSGVSNIVNKGYVGIGYSKTNIESSLRDVPLRLLSENDPVISRLFDIFAMSCLIDRFKVASDDNVYFSVRKTALATDSFFNSGFYILSKAL